MKKSKFSQHFDQAIWCAMHGVEVEYNSLKFKLQPMDDHREEPTSKDSLMINVVLKNALEQKEFVSYDEAIRLMSAGHKFYPLWAVVKRIDADVLLVTFSMRYGHLKTCHHQETGIPPFKNFCV